MATWTEDIVRALEELGGSATYERIYETVRGLRATPLPPTWQEVIRRQIQNHSSDSAGYKGGDDLFFAVQGIGRGQWGLRAAVPAPPVAVDLSSGEETPARIEQVTYRVIRDTVLSRQLKLLHRDECQLCGLALAGPNGATYSEAHHIIPLGREHGGPDVAENILVLCPNHHAQFDMGAVRLEVESIRVVPGHDVARGSAEYHNTRIYRGQP